MFFFRKPFAMRALLLLFLSLLFRSAVSQQEDASTLATTTEQTTTTVTTSGKTTRTFATVLQKNEEDYRLSLRSISVSHGSLTPEFSPDVTEYEVTLTEPVDVLAVSPEIDNNRPEYRDFGLPGVNISWKGKDENETPDHASAMIAKIDLPDDGSALDIAIEVKNEASGDSLTYTLSVVQAGGPVVLLKDLQVIDDQGNSVLIDPNVSEDVVVYHLYCSPDASRFTVTPTCSTGSVAYVNSRSIGPSTTIKREKEHHTQLVPLECRSTVTSDGRHKQYMLKVVSDFPPEDFATPPRVVEGSRRKECQFSEGIVHCPNPQSDEGRTTVVGFGDPQIRYTIGTPDERVHVRLLEGMESPRFPYTTRHLELKALAGRYSQSWPVEFEGVGAAGLGSLFSLFLGLKLGALLLSLLAILGVSNLCGVGTPIGVTEAATAMTFILQFYAFCSGFRGSSTMSDLSRQFRWVTLYWPMPAKRLLAGIGTHRSAAAGDDGHPAGAQFGDVLDPRNAAGCLFWAGVILASLITVHAILSIRLMATKPKATYPHRLLFGNWESRCIHWLAFPVTVACSHLLGSSKDDVSVAWKAAAAVILGLLALWAAVNGGLIASEILKSDNKVTWVWNQSAREDGFLDNEDGFWCDLKCDQLLSHPVNRSLFKSFFPFRWVSTAADIVPTNICPIGAGANGPQAVLFPPNHLEREGRPTNYPLGKNPKTVEVIRTVLPSKLCPGSRLICGLLRTAFLDILFTYEALTQFRAHVCESGGACNRASAGPTIADGDFLLPLTVKTCQLTGPITGGRKHFFYDGARLALIRLYDAIARVAVGLAIGLAVAKQRDIVDTAALGVAGVLALALFVLHLAKRPYARATENWITAALWGGVSLGCVGLFVCALRGTSGHKSGNRLADICLVVAAAVSVLLSLYACLVIFSIYSAIMCPPLEETRFLEKLSNCNVVIADHEDGWAVEVPAYDKNGAKDCKLQCTMTAKNHVHVSVYPSAECPTFEFDPEEILDACLTGTLAEPILSISYPDEDDPLNYRHLNVYDRGNLYAEVVGFLAMGRPMRHLAEPVARDVAHQLRSRGNGRIVVMSMMPCATSSK